MTSAWRLAAAIVAAMAGLGATAVGGSAQSEPPHEFVASLRGGQEVPPVATDAFGRADIEFNEDFSRIRIELSVFDGKAITQAHIHCAPRGVNGVIILFLAGFHDRGWIVDGQWIDNAVLTRANILDTSCGSTLADIARAMAEGGAYVNAHSVEHPSGEIRGQLREDPN